MNATDLHSLARRVEAADGAMFVLDREISDAMGHGNQLVRNYTASVDTAMLLVPEGWYWRVGHSTLYAGWANVHSKHPDFCDREDEHFAKAATPALALTAAALRARAASIKEQDDG